MRFQTTNNMILENDKIKVLLKSYLFLLIDEHRIKSIIINEFANKPFISKICLNFKYEYEIKSHYFDTPNCSYEF